MLLPGCLWGEEKLRNLLRVTPLAGGDRTQALAYQCLACNRAAIPAGLRSPGPVPGKNPYRFQVASRTWRLTSVRRAAGQKSTSPRAGNCGGSEVLGFRDPALRSLAGS